jgi:hypothetical protein
VSIVKIIANVIFAHMETELHVSLFTLFKGQDYLQDVMLPSFRGSGPPINTVKDQPVCAASVVKNWRKTAGQLSIALQDSES